MHPAGDTRAGPARCRRPPCRYHASSRLRVATSSLRIHRTRGRRVDTRVRAGPLSARSFKRKARLQGRISESKPFPREAHNGEEAGHSHRPLQRRLGQPPRRRCPGKQDLPHQGSCTGRRTRQGVSGPSTSSTRRTVRSGVATATATIPIRRQAEFRTHPLPGWLHRPRCDHPAVERTSHLVDDRRLESARVRRSRLGRLAVTVRFASFNVENLFARPKAFNQAT